MDEVLCPKCGNKMIIRTARKGRNAGKKFYECSNFPSCRGTREIYNSNASEYQEETASPKIPSSINEFPREFKSRSKYEETFETRFFECAAVSQDILDNIIDHEVEFSDLRIFTQWRLDYL